MATEEQNKKLVLRLAHKLSGNNKTEEMIREFTDSETYIKGVLMFEKGFPKYHIFIENITAQDNDVIVEGVFRGVHKGEIFNVPPTLKKVEFPMMIRYTVVDKKITEAYPLSDQMALFEQLGILKATP